MNLTQHMKSWYRTTDENRFNRRTIIGLIVVNLALVVALLVKGQTVVLVPPDLANEGWISSNRANPAVLESWGYYYATLLGNVTPKNAPALTDALSRGTTPALYHDLGGAILSQVKQVQKEEITTRFTPAGAGSDPKTGHVFVSGELITEGVRGTSDHQSRTYEFGFVVVRHQVLLDSMRIHKGDVKPGQEDKSP